MTVVAYALAGACALSAVIWSGRRGWRAAFLGGAILGFVVEGVIVSTMYDAFPFQLVWTPLAWHAVVTGGAVFGLHLAMVRRSAPRQAGAMVLLGLGGALWSAYWPVERPALPPLDRTLAYHLGSGLAAAAGLAWWDRMPRLPRPRPWVLLVVPVLALLLWVLQGISDPRPQRLALVPMVAATLWAMRRLGGQGEGPAGPPVPLWRHGLFLITPLVTALVAGLAVPGTAGWPVNVPVALGLGTLGLGLWLWLLWCAVRRPSAAPPPAR